MAEIQDIKVKTDTATTVANKPTADPIPNNDVLSISKTPITSDKTIIQDKTFQETTLLIITDKIFPETTLQTSTVPSVETDEILHHGEEKETNEV